MEKTYYIGLDVGSTTAKIAVIDSDNRVIYSKYERHNARVNELVSQYFDEILALTGDAEARICVTGNVGMATARTAPGGVCTGGGGCISLCPYCPS